ncbi:hypothetical protein AYY17_03115 [Morganella psychrotolerans]|uniref:Uncharacterized protein n=1 Tax=Morganella psychrotolerans TaxID=368603 RepID=A0A1B8HQT7_9GAMM|nr:hypothetical protein AYY17_03115 [Morganella psychrotolerans]
MGHLNTDKHCHYGTLFPKFEWLGHNQLNEGLKMKQEHDSISTSPISGKSPEEILEHFNKYNFVDDHGHRLEFCQDFIDLVMQATK